MAIDIMGANITANANAVAISTNGVTGLSFTAANFPKFNSKPFFYAQKNSAAWINYSAGAWNVLAMDYTAVNNGSHFNTTNGRFTAPITGTYWFTHSAYVYKATATSSDSYIHPIFRVNGSETARKASYTTDYRLRLRTYYSGGYSGDTQINDIFYLTAGDYVELYHYSSDATQQWYGTECFFAGFLIG